MRNLHETLFPSKCVPQNNEVCEHPRRQSSDGRCRVLEIPPKTAWPARPRDPAGPARPAEAAAEASRQPPLRGLAREMGLGGVPARRPGSSANEGRHFLRGLAPWRRWALRPVQWQPWRRRCDCARPSHGPA